MKKITYLIGAGASAHCLPVVKDMPGRIAVMKQILQQKAQITPLSTSYSYDSQLVNEAQLFTNLIAEFEWLLGEISKHSSVDTLAKKLYLKQKDGELRRLKVVLSIYFILEQLENKVDPRYDTFFAALLQENGKLPNNLRVLSWNYDMQFELGISDYTDSKKIIQAPLNVSRKFSERSNKLDEFGLYKMNGTTGFTVRESLNELYYIDSLHQGITPEHISNILKHFGSFLHIPNSVISTLSFAWEKPANENHDVVKKAVQAILKTEVLVVIGYSFPFFNREVDRELMLAMHTIDTIYIQDFNAEEVKDSLLSAWPLAYKPPRFVFKKPNDSQFFLPPEL